MFVAMHRFVQYCPGKTVHEPPGGPRIDFGNTERCPETASGKDRNAVKARGRMIDTQQDDQVVCVTASLGKGIGHDLTRIDVPGMGRYDGDGALGCRRHGIRQEPLDGGSQFFGIAGIETPRNRRRPDVVFCRKRGPDGSEKSCQKSGSDHHGDADAVGPWRQAVGRAERGLTARRGQRAVIHEHLPLEPKGQAQTPAMGA